MRNCFERNTLRLAPIPSQLHDIELFGAAVRSLAISVRFDCEHLGRRIIPSGSLREMMRIVGNLLNHLELAISTRKHLGGPGLTGAAPDPLPRVDSESERRLLLLAGKQGEGFEVGFGGSVPSPFVRVVSVPQKSGLGGPKEVIGPHVRKMLS